jgi:hypothetical protein
MIRVSMQPPPCFYPFVEPIPYRKLRRKFQIVEILASRFTGLSRLVTNNVSWMTRCEAYR